MGSWTDFGTYTVCFIDDSTYSPFELGVVSEFVHDWYYINAENERNLSQGLFGTVLVGISKWGYIRLIKLISFSIKKL